MSKEKIYVSSSRRYEDNSSTASSFLLVGAVMVLVLLLSTFGILKLPIGFGQQPVMFLALCFIAALFLLIGFYSLRKAKEFKGEMAGEAQKEKELLNWFSETFSKEIIDGKLDSEEFSNPQLLAFKRMELISDAFKDHDPSLEEAYVDHLVEEIYQSMFEAE